MLQKREIKPMAMLPPRIPLSKVILLSLLVTAVTAFYALGADRYLSYQVVRANNLQIHGFIQAHPMESVATYVGIYLLAAILCLPGITFFLTMVGGGLFGFWKGTLLAGASSTMGAFLAFLMVRYLFRGIVSRQLEGRWNGVKERLKKRGVRYILALRFTSAFPYFILNPLLALTAISPWTFLWTTAVGIFPTTMFYSYIGYRVGLMRVEGAFRILPLLVMLPVAIALVASPWVKKRLNPANR